jgi:hypothetical protein
MSFQGNKQIRTDAKSFETYQILQKIGVDKVTGVDLDLLSELIDLKGSDKIDLKTFQDFKSFKAATGSTKTLAITKTKKPIAPKKKQLVESATKPVVNKPAIKSVANKIETKPVVSKIETKPVVNKPEIKPIVNKPETKPTIDNSDDNKPVIVSENNSIVTIEQNHPRNQMKKMISDKLALWETIALHVDNFDHQATIELMITNFKQMLDDLNKL